MSRTRHLIAAGLAGLALAAAGCDSDDQGSDEPEGTGGQTEQSPVNPGSPGEAQGETTPAPEGSERGSGDGG